MPAHPTFRKLRREAIDRPLRDDGFLPYKSAALARITPGWVLHVLVFTPRKWGGEFTVDCVFRPLFASANKQLLLQPGQRVGALQRACGREACDWWANDSVEAVSSARDAIRDVGLPWLDENVDAESIVRSREGHPAPWRFDDTMISEWGHVLLRARRPEAALATFERKPSRVPKYGTLRRLATEGLWEDIDAIQWANIDASVVNLGIEKHVRAAGLT